MTPRVLVYVESVRDTPGLSCETCKHPIKSGQRVVFMPAETVDGTHGVTRFIRPGRSYCSHLCFRQRPIGHDHSRRVLPC